MEQIFSNFILSHISFGTRMLEKTVFIFLINFVLINTGLRNGRAILVQIHFYDIVEKLLLTIPLKLLKT
jgi:hypothetical protein